jgi:hypothetical protein
MVLDFIGKKNSNIVTKKLLGPFARSFIKPDGYLIWVFKYLDLAVQI